VVTRSISIIFYLLTIFLVYKLASYVRGRLFGLLSTLVVAVNPIFFTYAFEARNYTMFAFAATGSIYFLIKLSQKFTKFSALGFVVLSTLGIYTHYYMFFILAAQGLYLLLFDRGIFWKVTGLCGVIALLYLPWLPFLASQVKSVGGDYWIGAIDTRTHRAGQELNFRGRLTRQRKERIITIDDREDLDRLTQLAVRPALFSLSALLILSGIVGHIIRRHFEKPYLLIWLWAIVPFILAALPGLKIDGHQLPFRPIFFWRYLIGSAVPLSLVIVHTSEKLPKYLFATSTTAVILLSIIIDAMTFVRNPYTFRQAYQNDILPKISTEDKIVTVLPSFAEVTYYRNRFGLKNDLIVLPEGLVQFSGKSLLDAYVNNGMVIIDQAPNKGYFELRPGPSVQRTE